MVLRISVRGSAHCWVLRGHPVRGVSSGPWPGSPNALLVGVVVVAVGWGVVVR
jgi:hypothetical protein